MRVPSREAKPNPDPNANPNPNPKAREEAADDLVRYEVEVAYLEIHMGEARSLLTLAL